MLADPRPVACLKQSPLVSQGRIFVTDWDETATVNDTTGLIAGAATRVECSDMPPFSHFSKIYFEAYQAYVSGCSGGCGKRDSLSAEEAFQKGMRGVELSSVRALEQTGYFKGFPIHRFVSLAPLVELRPGFVDFVRGAECPVYVLSVNWCKRLIEAVLNLHGVENVTVLANDLETDEHGRTTGNFDPCVDIRTGWDKVKEMRAIKSKHPNLCLTYFGDSSGDVLPILSANTGGIIIDGKGRQILQSLVKLYSLRKTGRFLDGTKVFEASWEDLGKVWTSGRP